MTPFVQVCDEFRSCLTGEEGWAEIDRRAVEAVERTTRVKRKPPRCGGKRKAWPGVDWEGALRCPVAVNPSSEDLKLLSLSFGIDAAVLGHVHSMLVMGKLPGNIRRQQAEALAEQASWLGVFGGVFLCDPMCAGGADLDPAVAPVRVRGVPGAEGSHQAGSEGGHSQRAACVLPVPFRGRACCGPFGA